MGIRQFTEKRCKCIRKRKASECDCYLHTEVEENLYSWHIARRGWHAALLRQAGGKPCDCHIHGRPAKMARQLDLVREEEAAWQAAGAAAAEDVPHLALQAEAATAAVCELMPASTKVPSVAEAEARLAAAIERAASYDGMSESLQALFKALMPCGRVEYPEISTTGGLDVQGLSTSVH